MARAWGGRGAGGAGAPPRRCGAAPSQGGPGQASRCSPWGALGPGVPPPIRTAPPRRSGCSGTLTHFPRTVLLRMSSLCDSKRPTSKNRLMGCPLKLCHSNAGERRPPGVSAPRALRLEPSGHSRMKRQGQVSWSVGRGQGEACCPLPEGNADPLFGPRTKCSGRQSPSPAVHLDVSVGHLERASGQFHPGDKTVTHVKTRPVPCADRVI